MTAIRTSTPHTTRRLGGMPGTLEGSASAADAASVFHANGGADLLIVEDGIVLGVLSPSDLLDPASVTPESLASVSVGSLLSGGVSRCVWLEGATAD